MLCLLCQWIAARRLDDGVEPSRWVTRHHARCPACRAQHERHLRIMARLAADARGMMAEPPPFLHARILANLESAFVTADRHGPRRVPGWAFAVAGAAAVLLLVTLQFGAGPQRSAAPGVAQNNVRTGRVVLAGLPSLPGQETVVALGANLDAPLESELRMVMDDARMALLALSRNFLPTDLAGVVPK